MSVKQEMINGVLCLWSEKQQAWMPKYKQHSSGAWLKLQELTNGRLGYTESQAPEVEEHAEKMENLRNDATEATLEELYELKQYLLEQKTLWEQYGTVPILGTEPDDVAEIPQYQEILRSIKDVNLWIEQEENPTLPEGKYAMMRVEYLRTNRPELYKELTESGNLMRHANEVSRRTQQMVQSQALKMEQRDSEFQTAMEANDFLKIVGLRNNYLNRAEEMILPETVYG